MSHIEVQDLRKSFGRTKALAGVTLSITPGVTALLGPNGAGKTTLLRILATAIARSNGHVLVLGHDPATATGRLAIRRRLGYMPQTLGVAQRMTPFEYVDYVAVLKEFDDRRTRHDEVRRVLELCEVSADMHRRLGRLSGGQRRRVVMAQALLGDPAILVLDEPASGLDPEQRMRFREVVSRLSATRAVLWSTHMTEDVASVTDHVVVLDDGVVRFDGRPNDLADLATGNVWLTDDRDRAAQASWRTGDGQFRNIGDAPEGAQLVPPTIGDGYLRLIGR